MRQIVYWRDVNQERGRWGLVVWRRGAELSVGRRFYRVRWLAMAKCSVCRSMYPEDPKHPGYADLHVCVGGKPR